MSEPEVTKNTIKLAMRYQYKDGHTVRSWLPMDETYYSDGPIWIVLVACDYLK
jgi:cellobiose phosphorylase